MYTPNVHCPHGKNSCVTTTPELDYANVQKSRCLETSSFAFAQHQLGVRRCSTWTVRTSKCIGYTVTRCWSTESFNSEIGLNGGSLNAKRVLWLAAGRAHALEGEAANWIAKLSCIQEVRTSNLVLHSRRSCIGRSPASLDLWLFHYSFRVDYRAEAQVMRIIGIQPWRWLSLY